MAVAGGGVGIWLGTRARANFASACTAAPPSGSPGYQVTPEQAQNAAIIAAVALKMGMPDHAVTVALATALQESGLRDLPYGDRDSVGLFQQRPSEGWGTRAQILDPVYAATAFYSRLAHVPGWETIPVTEAAQAVQQSAAPSAYAPWESEARAFAAALTGEDPGAFTCHLDGFTGATPSATALTAAATSEMGAQLLGATVGTKEGWEVASWAVAHAWQYHISRVAFGSWAWTPGSGRWSRVAAPAGGADTVNVTYA